MGLPHHEIIKPAIRLSALSKPQKGVSLCIQLSLLIWIFRRICHANDLHISIQLWLKCYSICFHSKWKKGERYRSWTCMRVYIYRRTNGKIINDYYSLLKINDPVSPWILSCICEEDGSFCLPWWKQQFGVTFTRLSCVTLMKLNLMTLNVAEYCSAVWMLLTLWHVTSSLWLEENKTKNKGMHGL